MQESNIAKEFQKHNNLSEIKEYIKIGVNYYVDSGGTHYCNPQNPIAPSILIAPVAVIILEIQKCLGVKNQFSIVAHVITGTESKEITVEQNDMRCTKFLVDGFGIHNSAYDPKMMDEYLLTQVRNAQEVIVSALSGWNGNSFVTGNYVVGDQSIRIHETLKNLELFIKKDSFKIKSFKEVWQLLSKYVKGKIIEILLLHIILSIMYSVFKRSDLPRKPQYTLYIHGVSGTRKTTVIKTMLSFYKHLQYMDLSTGLSEARLADDLSLFRDSVLFIDDYVSDAKREDAKVVNKIVRLAGNFGSARKIHGKDAEMHSLVIIAGEKIASIDSSSIKRLITEEIKPGDADDSVNNMLTQEDFREEYAYAILDIIEKISEKDPDIVVADMYKDFCKYEQKIRSASKGQDFCDRRVEAYSWLLACRDMLAGFYPDCFDVNDMSLYDHALDKLEDYANETTFNSNVHLLCNFPNDNFGFFQKDSDGEKLESNKWGFENQDYLYICDTRMDTIVKKCGNGSINKAQLISDLAANNVLILCGRGYKTRKMVNRVSYKTYMLSRERINEILEEENQAIGEEGANETL